MTKKIDHQKAWDRVRRAEKIVVKVGTSKLATNHDSLRKVTRDSVAEIATEIAALSLGESRPRKVILVSSGAIGAGMTILGMDKRPQVLPELQATAALGQGLLMQWYMSGFEARQMNAAQVLLTRDDFEKRHRNIEATLDTLLNKKIVPIINENDTVSVEEIRFGDNDLLSAYVAALVKSDLLVIISDVDHLKGTGQAEFPRFITKITSSMEKAATGSSEEFSQGGMKTKLQAAQLAMKRGIPMLLLDRAGVAEALRSDRPVGTLFYGSGR